MPDTSYHSWTMPTVDGSTDVWGQELNDMFDNEIDAVVERRGTLANRPGAANVPSGAKYLVTSGSEVGTAYVESGGSWVELGRFVADDPTFGDVTYDSANGWYWADSPDDVNTVLTNDVPDGGGIVLSPGTYDETDWTSTISIPRVADTGYTIDLSLARFVVGSDTAMPDPLIELPQPGTAGSEDRVPLRLIGPRLIDGDVLSGSNAGAIAELWGNQNSHVEFPKVLGEWDVLVRDEGDSGSGHMNRYFCYANGADKMFEIGPNSSISIDRSWYFGQHARIGETCVDIQLARNNVFWVQPENNRSTPTSTAQNRDNGVIGYNVQDHSNTILLCHRLTDTPLNIEGRDTYLGPNVYTSGEIMQKSNIGNFKPLGPSQMDKLSVRRDETSLYDTNGVTLTNFGDYQIDAGTSDGATSYLQTPGRLGNVSSAPLMIEGVVDPDVTSDVIIKVGVWEDDSNYAMLVFDPSVSSNWLFRVLNGGTNVTGGGVGNGDVDTGVSVSAQQYDFSVQVNDTGSGYDHKAHVATVNSNTIPAVRSGGSISSWTALRRGRIDVTVNGTPGSARTAGIQQIVHGQPSDD